MAKKIALRFWSAIISSLAFLVTGAPTQGAFPDQSAPRIVNEVVIRKSKKPIIFLEQARATANDAMIAGHSSHRSHASHRSHYSSRSGGGYTPYTPPASPPQEEPKSYDNETPRMLPESSAPKKKAPASEVPTQKRTINKHIKMIYLKDGGQVPCNGASITDDSVHFVKDGKNFELPLNLVDLAKTLTEALDKK